MPSLFVTLLVGWTLSGAGLSANAVRLGPDPMGVSPIPRLGADTTVVVGDGVRLSLVPIEPGSFQRTLPDGSTQTVTLTRPFWMGSREVSWAQWSPVMGWDDGRGQPDHPARRMSWSDIQEFVFRLNASTEGWRFRLPTEAEWEYAARAGRSGDGTGNPDLEDEAWIRANSGGAIQPVGTRRPNAWGLYDMQGNVWEWLADWAGPYPEADEVVDPTGPPTGDERVRRGGSAVYGAAAAAFSHRYQQPPARGNGNLGFRLVAEPQATPAVPPGPASRRDRSRAPR